jgi:hypothetical protein
MHRARMLVQKIRWTRALRRGVEYAAAIALAMLSSYWIMQGRW